MKINISRVLLDASLVPDENLIYHSGMFFTVMTTPRVVRGVKFSTAKHSPEKISAIGGRFDNTLHLYGNKPLFGVGVEISCDDVMKGMYDSDYSNETEHTGAELLVSFKKAATSPEGESKMKECAAVMWELWKRGVAAAADFFMEQSTDDWIKYCQKNNYKKLAIVALVPKKEKDSLPQLSVTIIDLLNPPKKDKAEDITILDDLDAVENFLLEYTTAVGTGAGTMQKKSSG